MAFSLLFPDGRQQGNRVCVQRLNPEEMPPLEPEGTLPMVWETPPEAVVSEPLTTFHVLNTVLLEIFLTDKKKVGMV